jgi:capsular polysaccharide biosynthesis protein
VSGQALDLKRSVQIIRRHRILVGALAVAGLIAGASYTLYKPPMFSTSALVVVPNAKGFATASSAYVDTQVVIAHSDPVLIAALPHVGAPMSLATLRNRVKTTDMTSNVVSIAAEGRTARQAEATANAVAGSYLSFLDSAASPVGRVRARILGKATPATGTSLLVRMTETAGIGLLPGLLIGIVLALAIGCGDRRLRERDQIADSIGVPVLASVPAEHPRDAPGWAKLLDHYEPGLVDAWHLRKALFQMGLVGLSPASAGGALRSGDGGGSSLSVLSLSSDQGALSLGPQLATFAASLGIRTALVVGPQQNDNVTAGLYTACAAASPPARSGYLQVAVMTGHDNVGVLAGAALTVAVGVVDGENPRVADTVRAATTVLAVSAGAATAEQLARVATSAAVDDREIAGILVADPDPADQTTGRLPQVSRPAERPMPTRTTAAAIGGRR